MNVPPVLTRPRFRRSIAVRMSLAITAILLVGFALLAAVETVQQRRLLESHIEQFGQLLGQQLATAATEPLFIDHAFELLAMCRRYVDNPQVLGAAIYSHDGRLVASAGYFPAFDQLPASGEIARRDTATLQTRQPARQERSALLLAEPISFRDTVGGYAVIALSRRSLDDSLRHIVQTSLVAAALLSLLTCLVSLYLGRRLARPIHNLVDATRQLERGEFIPVCERRNDEFGELAQSINLMGQGVLRTSQVEGILNRFLDREVASKLLEELEPAQLGGEQVEASVLFADIVGFTSLSEKLSPTEVSHFLNEYFHYFDVCARFYFGTIDKFIGDAVMVVFGAPRPDPYHAYHAAACGVLMQQLADRLNQRRRARGKEPVYLRIGVNSGEMLAGVLGSRQRVEYTVVGDAVNLASRLCGEAQPGEVIVSESIKAAIAENGNLSAGPERTIQVRGKEAPVAIYAVHGNDSCRPAALNRLIEDLLTEELS